MSLFDDDNVEELVSSIFGVPSRSTLLRQAADRIDEQDAREVEMRLALNQLVADFGDEPIVLWFRFQFDGKGVIYTHAATQYRPKWSPGPRWSFTGGDSTSRTTAEFARWLSRGTVHAMWVATEWEEV
jgi:hypothetical protein